MKKKTCKSIDAYMKPYSIAQKRVTTINHAFASAIAPAGNTDSEIVRNSLIELGLDPDNLKCVYCEEDAQDWDHLVGLVKEGEFRGYGHQVGNLVPCCKKCNNAKGGSDWMDFLKKKFLKDSMKKESLEKKLTARLEKYAVKIDLCSFTKTPEWKNYQELKKEIVDKMKAADDVAKKIRNDIEKSISRPSR